MAFDVRELDGPKLRVNRQSWMPANELGRLVEAAQQGDPLAPVTVVGPSTYANLTLRHQLASSGFANVRFLPLPRLSEFLGAPSLAAQGHRPLTPITENASVRSVTGRSPGILAEVKSHPSTILSLRNTFRQLRHASDETLVLLSNRDQLRKDVVKLYRDFREETQQYYDSEDLARAAAAAVATGNAPGLADLGFILLFHIRNISPGERDLVGALGKLGQCAAVLGLTGDPEADGPTAATGDELSEFLGSPVREEPGGGTLPRFQEPAGKRLLIAPDPQEEVRWVIRQIVKRTEEGTPFHRMAVLYGPQSPYNALVREELQAAGIPAAGPNPFSLGSTAPGRTLTGLLELAGGELHRNTVMSWLMGCPVAPPLHENRSHGATNHGHIEHGDTEHWGAVSGAAGNFSPSNWDAISKKAGVVRGLEQWKERLTGYAIESETSAWQREAQGEISGAKTELMAGEARQARELLRFVETLSGELGKPHEGWSWSDYSSWAEGLLEGYLYLDSQAPDAEHKALKEVKGLLEELSGADEVAPPPDLPGFKQALDEALQTSAGHLGVTGQGVFVGPIASASAMSFDVIHVTGMIEGAVPGPARDDPLLPDGDKEAAGGPEAGLPLRRARLVDERHAYLSALAAAPECTLSFPKASPAGQRGYYPSRWFLEQASVLEGKPVHTSDLWLLGQRDWLTVIASLAESVASAGESAPADEQDYKLERLWSWRLAGLDPAAHPLARRGLLERSLRLGRNRYANPDFTEWDGNLSKVMTGGDRAPLTATSIVSPTSLERWAACPFSYFLGNVLGLGSLEDPEEVYSMTPLEKGALVHRILEEFIGKAKEEGTVPEPGQPWNAGHRRLMESIALENFRQAESRGATGKELMWRLEREDIVNDLYSFLEADAGVRERFGMSPSFFETRFGMAGSPWPEAALQLDDGTAIRFRGIIDRVDTNGGGSEALVLDYKSGRAASYRGIDEDPIDGGRRLQLAVYSLAAQAAFGPEVKVRSAYWFVSTRGGFAIFPGEGFDISEYGAEERVKEGVAGIVSGIRGGIFPANPGRPDRDSHTNCRYCDFDSLCPSRRGPVWERKKGHPLLEGYIQLTEGEQP